MLSPIGSFPTPSQREALSVTTSLATQGPASSVTDDDDTTPTAPVRPRNEIGPLSYG